MADFPPRTLPPLPPLLPPPPAPALAPIPPGPLAVPRYTRVVESKGPDSPGAQSSSPASVEARAIQLAPNGYRCKVCQATCVVWQRLCPRCEATYALVEDVASGSILGRLRTPGQIGVRPVARLDSGVAVVNTVMGGGVPRGTMTVVLGPKGSGKSTVVLQVCIFCEAERPLYVTSEESEQELQDRMYRLGEFDQTRPQLLFTKDAREVMRAIREYRADFVGVDSLQKFYDPTVEGVMEGQVQIHNFVNLIYGACKREKFTVMAVSRQTSAGKALGGSMVEYEPDAVLAILKGKDPHRLFRPRKLRYGGPGDVPALLQNEGMELDVLEYERLRGGGKSAIDEQEDTRAGDP